MADQRYTLKVDSAGKVTATDVRGRAAEASLHLDPTGPKLLKRLLKELDRQDADFGREDFAELGSLLHGSLIREKVLSHYTRAYENAVNNSDVLCVQLDFDERGRLGECSTSALPWEFLYNDSNGFLATDKNLTLSRFIPLDKPIDLQPAELPLRVLFVGSQPNELGKVFVVPGVETVQCKLEERISAGQVRIQINSQPDRRSLSTDIQEFRPHFVHFMGHARFVESDGGSLALVNPVTKDPIWLPAMEAGGLFQNWKPHAMLVVACEGARESLSAPISSVASAVARENVAFIGMRFPLRNDVALAFTRAFYEQLAAGTALDEATQAARRAVHDFDPQATRRDFGGVVLFLRSANCLILPRAGDPASKSAGSVLPPQTNDLAAAVSAYKHRILKLWHGKDETGQDILENEKPTGQWVEMETDEAFREKTTREQ